MKCPSRTVSSRSAMRLTVTLEAADVAMAGALKIVVVNPTGEASEE
jgi:hypothetical protein